MAGWSLDPWTCGPLAPRAGEVATGWLTVGEDWRREDLAVPLVVARGARPGPAVYLQAVSDGDELNGLAVLRGLLAELEPGALAGTLVIVPIANPGAFAAGTTADPRDGRKLNRCFPGDPAGSPTERLAYTLFHELVLRCDLAIDLHQNGVVPMIPEVRIRTGRRGPKHAECLELALAFGLPHLLDQQGPAGQLARVAPARGIPTIDPELGGNLGLEADSVALGLRGVRNILRRWGLLTGQPEPLPKPFIASRLVPLPSPGGGFVEWLADLGEAVVAGQAVARLTDVFGAGPRLVVAPADGVVWSRRHQPQVSAGETLLHLGVAGPE